MAFRLHMNTIQTTQTTREWHSGHTRTAHALDVDDAPALFAQVMTSQAQVIVHAPHFTAGRGFTPLDRGPHLRRAAAGKPGTAAANGAEGVCVAIAQLRPAIALAIALHGDAVGVKAAKAGVPRLDTV